jgi:flagellar biosynthetic protein FlhB
VAESESGQERSEDATSKRQEKAREEGQVARSRELNTTFVLLAGSWGLLTYGPGISLTLSNLMRFNLSMPRAAAFDSKLAVAHLYYSVMTIANDLLPFLGLLLAASLAGPILMGGWLFSPSAMMPKFSRLDPLAGIKRMFSLTALVELVKSLAKFAVLSGIAFTIVNSLKGRLFALGMQPLQTALADALSMSAWAVMGVSCGMILIAMLDVPYQLFDHNKKLKMTKQEIKEEMKDSEGRPEVKGRIRQLQREIARRRMMEAVPKADVIITNPEHFSVALRYDSGRSSAPIVIAKGADQIAMKIREIARAHNIAQLPAPTLARAIYYTTDIDREIPAPLYLAVAQVLAYVFQLKNWRAGQGRKPQAPDVLPVPNDWIFDQKGRRVAS